MQASWVWPSGSASHSKCGGPFFSSVNISIVLIGAVFKSFNGSSIGSSRRLKGSSILKATRGHQQRPRHEQHGLPWAAR